VAKRMNIKDIKDNWYFDQAERDITILSYLNGVGAPKLYDAWICDKGSQGKEIYMIMEKFDGIVTDNAIVRSIRTIDTLDIHIPLGIYNSMISCIRRLDDAEIIHNDLHIQQFLWKIGDSGTYVVALTDYGFAGNRNLNALPSHLQTDPWQMDDRKYLKKWHKGYNFFQFEQWLRHWEVGHKYRIFIGDIRWRRIVDLAERDRQVISSSCMFVYPESTN
jgi:serine/threonine protein kinase